MTSKTRTRANVSLVLALSIGVPAWGGPLHDEYQLEIERQSLRKVLSDFSKQTRLSVFVQDGARISDTPVGPISGRYTTDAALNEIVQNTEFTFRHVSATTVALVPRGKSRLKQARLDDSPGAERAPRRDNRQTVAATRSPNDGRTELGDVEEVIVTAQKRAQDLQEVPISISVLGGADLDTAAGIGATEALRSAPGVATTTHHQGGGTQISVRGVAANGALFRGSSPVAYYLDNSPFGMVKNAAAPDANVYDLERIEVLRGPQGTLYGASAQSGVVRILTRDANPDALEFKARTSTSTTERGGNANYRGDVAINVPIVDGRLAARVVGGHERLSGWIDKPNQPDANDAELSNIRFKIHGRPTDTATVDVSSWFSRAEYGAPSTSANGRTHFSLEREPLSTDYDVFSVKMSNEFSAVSVSSVTSYLEFENHAREDLRGEGFEGEQTTSLQSDVFSQEFVLNSNLDGAWRWSAGAFYRDVEDRRRQDVFAGGTRIVAYGVGDLSKSIAVFGEVTRLFADETFELTGGLRYFEDDVTQSEILPVDDDFDRPLIRSKSTFDKISPRVVLAWHPVKSSTIYASYAEGFRSGFNQYADLILNFPDFPKVKPDNLKNYEIGAKGSFWGDRFRYDTALYYLDWQDVQLVRSVIVDGIFAPAPLNGDSASGLGFEFAVKIAPTDGIDVGINLGWNDLTSDSLVLSRGLPLFNKGDRLNYSPEMTAGASVDYHFPLSESGFEGRFSTSATYTSMQTFRNIEGGVSVNYRGSPLTIVQGSFSVHSPTHWVTTLYVDNLTDETGPLVRGPFGEPDNAPRLRPRTVGVQFEYRY